MLARWVADPDRVNGSSNSIRSTDRPSSSINSSLIKPGSGWYNQHCSLMNSPKPKRMACFCRAMHSNEVLTC
eukprot:scaffold1594_cov401-Prasinococcus_capsulatus_cf.AAC.19